MVDGNFFHEAIMNGFDLLVNLTKIFETAPVLVMTKCVLRELENLGKDISNTLAATKKIVKESCKHPGGCIPADECIKTFIGKKNESKLFVATNDEVLRNELRNLSVVPTFFFKKGCVLVLDAPTEIAIEKHRLKE
eukprot:CAMPEP_0202963526 /NCGR_PEP_ID=MMETSP1396-20130829/7528_1 /ASSEMBLY_ACC=CAM_ASM_000872 /TAXON_ID= /ORGANISM="Pseudokeronopsis sp., Strain Brazil" /LENGTH=135 /DNA_ID=CAMNT_0049684815 /DNA_START=75 /DNA_END=482 /DNA_ORIENTATION=-